MEGELKRDVSYLPTSGRLGGSKTPSLNNSSSLHWRRPRLWYTLHKAPRKNRTENLWHILWWIINRSCGPSHRCTSWTVWSARQWEMVSFNSNLCLTLLGSSRRKKKETTCSHRISNCGGWSTWHDSMAKKGAKVWGKGKMDIGKIKGATPVVIEQKKHSQTIQGPVFPEQKKQRKASIQCIQH